jgi:hypothetical protein
MGNQMTKDEILSMAKEAGIGILYEYDGPDHAGVCDWKDIERFAALVAEKEREECAMVCDLLHVEYEEGKNMAVVCGANIRARGQK